MLLYVNHILKIKIINTSHKFSSKWMDNVYLQSSHLTSKNLISHPPSIALIWIQSSSDNHNLDHWFYLELHKLITNNLPWTLEANNKTKKLGKWEVTRKRSNNNNTLAATLISFRRPYLLAQGSDFSNWSIVL